MLAMRCAIPKPARKMCGNSQISVESGAMLLLLVGSFILVLCISIAARVVTAAQHMQRLAVWPFRERVWPQVSIIVCARNEQESIRDAVLTLLNQDYPQYELLVVNDRSTDATQRILEEVQANEPRLNLVHLQTLPEGWLGKCNAMHVGAQSAHGEWILFTDADVSMKPDTLKRAIDYALSEEADHLSMVPECEMPSTLLHLFVATFSVFFKILVKPSQIANPKSEAHCGIGAFNLVRTEVYRSLGGHEPIRLRPDDDLKLGKLIKTNGYRQRFANGLGLISVPWYPSVAALVRGLEKNSFAGMDYSWPKLIASNIILPSMFVLPWIALFLVTGPAWWLFLASCAVVQCMAIHNAVSVGYPWYFGLFFPLGVLMFLFIVDRAVFLTVKRGGIYWRDHFYSLNELKTNQL
jgi:glycosyltransferase involved in cell wall biosynthesis